MTTTWTYKVFYYTVLSFSLIGFLMSTSSLIKNIFYQSLDIQDDQSMSLNLGFLGIGQNQEKKQDKAKEFAKKYVDSAVPLILSTAVGVIFTMYLKPKEVTSSTSKHKD